MSKEKINPLEFKLSRVCFTNDKSMFCITHDQGFLVCKASPFAILNNRILGGDISIAQMLDMSNIIFLASGGGEHPRFPLTHVIMYDDHKGKPIAKLQIGHRIKNIKSNASRLFIVGKSSIFLFKTEDLSNVGTFESYEENEEGICSLSESKDNIVFAYPAKTEGYVNIMKIKNKIIDVKSFFAHNKRIACIDLNKNGNRLISSSIDGTIIRVFDTNNGDIIDEFKRGNDKAQIFSLSFTHDNKFICCSSDKGTIHIFKLSEYDQNYINELNQIVKKFGKDILDKSVVNRQSLNIPKSRKFAFCRTNEENAYLVFSENDKIHLVSLNEQGKFYIINFDKEKGGEGKITEAFEILCEENLSNLNP